MPANDAPRKYLLCTGEVVHAEKLKAFPRAHVVAEVQVRFDREIGRNVVELAIYRVSVATADMLSLASRPLVAGYVPSARKVPCSLCERGPRWDITQSAFDALMSRYGSVRVE